MNKLAILPHRAGGSFDKAELLLRYCAHFRLDRKCFNRKNSRLSSIFSDGLPIMHTLEIHHTGKAGIYQQLLPQIESLMADEPNLIANLANISAVLKAAFGWLWIGFYLTDHTGRQLVLGPFQGPLACTRIAYGRGVCGQAWARGETIVVPDVNAHPDHIACSSLSQSEIVVPVFHAQGQLMAVLDADADTVNQFNAVDAQYLGELAAMIGKHHSEAV